VILRGTVLSVKSTQVRYVARGTTGTFTKVGVDVQEDQLRALQNPAEIRTSVTFGQEPEDIFAVLENQRDKAVVRSMCVSRLSHPVTGAETKLYSWPSKEKGNYLALFEDLAKTIRQGTPPAIKFKESAEVLEIIELALKSSTEGRTLDIPPRS
jgi:predicted dehydrogenase